MIEIRNYHYDPSKMVAYKKWAVSEAIPFLKANLDLVGFWLENIEPPELSGSNPMDLELGSANVTWIIRWESMEARKQAHKEVFGGEGWQNIWANHPDENGYLQMEARFTKEY